MKRLETPEHMSERLNRKVFETKSRKNLRHLSAQLLRNWYDGGGNQSLDGFKDSPLGEGEASDILMGEEGEKDNSHNGRELREKEAL